MRCIVGLLAGIGVPAMDTMAVSKIIPYLLNSALHILVSKRKSINQLCSAFLKVEPDMYTTVIM